MTSILLSHMVWGFNEIKDKVFFTTSDTPQMLWKDTGIGGGSDQTRSPLHRPQALLPAGSWVLGNSVKDWKSCEEGPRAPQERKNSSQGHS